MSAMGHGMGLLIAIAFLAGVAFEFPTQGRVAPPYSLRNVPKRDGLLLYGVQMIPFFLAQLSHVHWHWASPPYVRQ